MRPSKPIKINVEEIIQKTVDLILQQDKEHKIKAILLFGSHADGTAIWRSDIDICVVFKEDSPLLEAGLFRKELMGQLHDFVDLQVFNVLPLKIKRAIVDNHKILFKSPEFDEDAFTSFNHKLFFESQRRIVAVGVN